MKYTAILALFVAALCLHTLDASAQVKINLKEKIKREANKRANRKTDKAINKSFDKMEEGLKGIVTKDAKGDTLGTNPEGKQVLNTSQEQVSGQEDQANQAEAEVKPSPTLSWSKFDFVPGDKIIFEDNLIYEENGEFPSRWDLVNGTVENAEFGGEKIIMFRGGQPVIIPYLKNPEIDYLPDVFTIEFDLYMNNHNSLQVIFWDRKNQRASSAFKALDINYHQMTLQPFSSRIPGKASIVNQWAHISIAYTNGKMKAYINETRLINIPHLEFDPMGISLSAYHASDENQFFVKNFRLAEGGVKYYDRFLQDGKIVSNGIRFDVGKATLRPESMGVLNEIYKMLSEYPGVAVSVEGHTDSDGDNDLNQKLSEDRAEAVMKQLVSMGMSKDRLSFRGYGESKPVAPNDTPEGKASNRRVEFVKTSGPNSQDAPPSMISQANGDHGSSKKKGEYKTVTIGNQVWMQENLDVDTFRNGDPIPQAKSAEEWQNMRYEKKAGWCYYNFESSDKANIGRLYNWYAVNDIRGLAPEGWRVPFDDDWTKLKKKLVIGVAGKKMKSYTGWKDGGNGTNTSGFNGLPGGYCDYNGEFSSLNSEAYWWSSSDDGTQWSPSIYLSAEDDYLHRHQMSKGSGLFVRCIREKQ